MSRKAQAWQMLAVRGKKLKPGPKLVMCHLADRHTPDHGCFPGLDRLADETEIPMSNLKRYLNDLEKAGLFVRVQRKRANGQRDITRFVLAFESDYEEHRKAWEDQQPEPEPGPNMGHGSMVHSGQGPGPKNADSDASTPYRSELNKELREGAAESEETAALAQADVGHVNTLNHYRALVNLRRRAQPGGLVYEHLTRQIEAHCEETGLSVDEQL